MMSNNVTWIIINYNKLVNLLTKELICLLQVELKENLEVIEIM